MENELIKRFAEVQGVQYEEAEKLVGADSDEEIMNKITNFTVEKINGGVTLNRAQRRALAKKNKGKKKKVPFGNPITEINETAAKLNYIDLIQKLRALNEKKAKEIEEDGDAETEDN